MYTSMRCCDIPEISIKSFFILFYDVFGCLSLACRCTPNAPILVYGGQIWLALLHNLAEQRFEVVHAGGPGVARDASVGVGLGQELQILLLHGLQPGGDAHVCGELAHRVVGGEQPTLNKKQESVFISNLPNIKKMSNCAEKFSVEYITIKMKINSKLG